MANKAVIRLIGSFLSDVYFSSGSLLKTFSIYRFQGQYPDAAVRINATPINPNTQRKIPSMKKAKVIKMTPVLSG
jgi:hypothetical protein